MVARESQPEALDPRPQIGLGQGRELDLALAGVARVEIAGHPGRMASQLDELGRDVVAREQLEEERGADPLELDDSAPGLGVEVAEVGDAPVAAERHPERCDQRRERRHAGHVNVMVRVDVGRLRTGQLTEARQLGGERASGVAGLVDLGAVLLVVQADRERGILAREPGGVRGRGTAHHQAGARDDAADVRLDDALVDAGREAEVVRVDDQSSHLVDSVGWTVGSRCVWPNAVLPGTGATPQPAASRARGRQVGAVLVPPYAEPAARIARRVAEIELVGLPGQVDPEAVVGLLRDQHKAALEVEVASGDQRMVGPQPYAGVSGAAREREALVDQPPAEVVAAPIGMDEQDPKQRRALVLGIGHAEDAPHPPSVELGDPGGLEARVTAGGVVGHDPGHECLEARVPAELARVDLAVGHHDPPEVAGSSQAGGSLLKQSFQ